MAITFGPVARRSTRGGSRADRADRVATRAGVSLTNRLLLSVSLLMLVGLVFVFSASSVQSLEVYGSSWAVFVRQLWFVLGGFALMLVVSRVPFQSWRRLAPLLYVGATAAVASTFFIGTTHFGSRRWLDIGPVVITPSEMLKLGMLLALAALLTMHGDGAASQPFALRQALIIVGLSAFLVIAQPDMGTTSIIVVIALSLLVVAGIRAGSLAKVFAACAVLALFAAKLSPYRWRRVMVMFNPGSDVTNAGYHAYQSRLGFASGRFFGVGVGASRSKWGFLPNAHTDFIFTVIGEEVGLIGVVFVLALFMFFVWTAIRAALACGDRFGMLVATGVTVWVAAQAAVNMGTAIGLVPVTGVPMPFVSAGGTSTLVVMTGVGILLNVARQAERTGRRPSASRSASLAAATRDR